MHSINFATPIRASFIVAPLLLSLAGCGAMKTEGANFALDIRVGGTDSNGVKLKATPEQIPESQTNQQASSAFQSRGITNNTFLWKFAMGATGMGGAIWKIVLVSHFAFALTKHVCLLISN